MARSNHFIGVSSCGGRDVRRMRSVFCGYRTSGRGATTGSPDCAHVHVGAAARVAAPLKTRSACRRESSRMACPLLVAWLAALYARRSASATIAAMMAATSFWLRAALVIALLLTATPAAAQLPIFDAHIHYSRPDWTTYTPERALSILAQAGIRRAIVSSTPDDGTLMLYDRAPAGIVPFLRPYRTREDMGSWPRDPAVAAYVEERADK